MQRIKKGDDVVIRIGKDKGKLGKVLGFKENKVLVEGVNKVKKHQKGNPSRGVEGGIVEKEMPLDISNVGLYNPKTKKVDRIGFRFLEDGKKVRFFKSTNELVGS
ncbi:MAG: 50S ribosomal protein L24 [Methylococcales bacterium]|nr:50S ribosomal protein L24 [Methylococcales bacterium]